MAKNRSENFKILALIALALLAVLVLIATPKKSKLSERNKVKLIKSILEVCPPLPDKFAYSIPGYKSVQCFYQIDAKGKPVLITDLNQPVSIPKPVDEVAKAE